MFSSILPAAIIDAAASIGSGREKHRFQCCEMNFFLGVAGEELNPIHILATIPHHGMHAQRTFTSRGKFDLNRAIDGEFDSSKDGRAIRANIANPGIHQPDPVRSRDDQTYRNIQTEPFVGAYCLILCE